MHSHNDIIINHKARIVKYLAFVCKQQNFNFTQLTNGQSKKKITKTNPDNFERCTVGFTLSHYSNILSVDLLTVLHFVWHSFWHSFLQSEDCTSIAIASHICNIKSSSTDPTRRGEGRDLRPTPISLVFIQFTTKNCQIMDWHIPL